MACYREALLADDASSGQVSAYLGTPVPDGTLVTKRSNFGTACSVTAVGLALNSSSLLKSPSPMASLSAVRLSTPSSRGACSDAWSYANTPGPLEAEGIHSTWLVWG